MNLEADHGLMLNAHAFGPASFTISGRDVLLEGLEVFREHAGQLLRLRVVLGGVGPGPARIEHFIRHAGTGRRHVDVEHRVTLVLDVVELPRQRGGDHRARVRDLHAAADAVWTTGPSRVDQPHARLVLGDLLAEHPRACVRIERQKRRAETGAERRLRLRHALLDAGHARRVAGQEVIHRSIGRQPGDWRQHPSIGGEHHHVARMPGTAGQLGVVDEVDGVGAAGVFGERGVVEVEGPCVRIDDHVLEDGAEAFRRRVNLRLRFG